MDEEFEELAQEVSDKAAAIQCSPSDYREGLRGIIDRLRDDLAASKETAPDGDEDDER